MSRKSYLSTQAIHDMSTRQLREYIYQNSREAEERMKTIDLKTAPKALQDQARLIINDRGKVKKSTSYLRKDEMVEMAYALRDFNMLDVQSEYARNKEWESGKTNYTNFIREQSKIKDSYWLKYLVNGEVSEAGFTEYKMFVNFLRQIGDTALQYGYDDVVQWIEEEFGSESATDNLQLMVKVLTDVYNSAGGISQDKLIEKFKLEYSKAKKKQSKKTTSKKTSGKKTTKSKKTGKTTYQKGKKSKSDYKIKKGRKMKESGKVRRRIN